MFTIEQTISGSVVGNDVSLISCALGELLAGRELDFEMDPNWTWAVKDIRHPADRIAALIVLLDALAYLPRPEKPNYHTDRVFRLFTENFSGQRDQVSQRIQELAETLRLTDFVTGDVYDFVQQNDGVFIMYPPTYKNGYERQYRRLDKITRWNRPVYKVIDDDRRSAMLDLLTTRKYIWFDDRVLDRPLAFRDWYGRSRCVYGYSNFLDDKWFTESASSPEIDLPFPIMRETAVGEKVHISVAQIDKNQMIALKNAYLGKSIRHSTAGRCFAILIDGRMAGAFEVNLFFKFMAVDTVYLLSDFATCNIPRISKLVVMIAKSAEMHRFYEKQVLRRLRQITTTAFTDKPVSMKYRGVMDLVKRGTDKTGNKFLQYQAEFDELTNQQEYEQWLTKYARQSKS